MKTNYTIFFDKGVMKGFETPKELPLSFESAHYVAARQQHDEEYLQEIETARLSALPIAQESKEKVKYEIWKQHRLSHFYGGSDLELNQSKEYKIEAEFEENRQFSTHSSKNGKLCTITMCYYNDPKKFDKCLGWCQKVLVLVNN